jgi:hypothetical protein
MISSNVGQDEQMLRLCGLLKALRDTVRNNDFKVAQRLRFRLAGMKQHIEEGLHDQLEKLSEISGQWIRGVGNRHEDKVLIKQLIERALRRFRRSKARRLARYANSAVKSPAGEAVA